MHIHQSVIIVDNPLWGNAGKQDKAKNRSGGS